MLELVREMQRQQAEHDERMVRSLLERWVSGLEPAIVYRDNKIAGLCDADAPLGSKPFVLEVEQ